MWSGRSSVVPSLLLLACVLTGCQNKAKQSESGMAASQQDVAAIRSRIMAADPNARVGVVTAVLPKAQLAAIGDVPLQDFAIGDIVTFIDSHEKPFNSGTVVNATSTSLHVKYELSRRAPREGDLAVRLR